MVYKCHKKNNNFVCEGGPRLATPHFNNFFHSILTAGDTWSSSHQWPHEFAGEITIYLQIQPQPTSIFQ